VKKISLNFEIDCSQFDLILKIAQTIEVFCIPNFKFVLTSFLVIKISIKNKFKKEKFYFIIIKKNKKKEKTKI
jgi:hypothetical protein